MLIALLLVLTGGQPSPSDEPDSERIQGTWELTSVVIGGKPRHGAGRGRTMRIEGDAFTMMSEGKVRRKGTFTLRPAKTPSKSTSLPTMPSPPSGSMSSTATR